jgi:hypothetical protein
MAQTNGDDAPNGPDGGENTPKTPADEDFSLDVGGLLDDDKDDQKFVDSGSESKGQDDQTIAPG